jgi:hypothetical protein
MNINVCTDCGTPLTEENTSPEAADCCRDCLVLWEPTCDVCHTHLVQDPADLNRFSCPQCGNGLRLIHITPKPPEVV